MSDKLELRVLDNTRGAELSAINHACPIRADFTLVFDRDPDFFAWPKAVFDEFTYVGGFLDGELVAYALFGVATGWLGDGYGPFFYVGDARVLPKARGRRFTQRAAAFMLTRAPRGAVGFGLVKKGNDPALHVVASTRLPGVTIEPLCGLDVESVVLLRRPRCRLAYRVRRARPEDLGTLVSLMGLAHQRRLLAPPPTEESLRADFERLPGFTPESFFVAFAGDEPVGTLGVWDAGPVRRSLLLRYSPRGQLTRAAYAAARILCRRAAPLPRPGEPLRSLTTTRLAIPSNNPMILRDLLCAVFCAYEGTGYHLMHVALGRPDPLAEGLRPFLHQPFSSDVFWMAYEAEPRPIDCGPPYLDLRFI